MLSSTLPFQKHLSPHCLATACNWRHKPAESGSGAEKVKPVADEGAAHHVTAMQRTIFAEGMPEYNFTFCSPEAVPLGSKMARYLYCQASAIQVGSMIHDILTEVTGKQLCI